MHRGTVMQFFNLLTPAIGALQSNQANRAAVRYIGTGQTFERQKIHIRTNASQTKDEQETP
ncbi:MAG: hypothetical protein JWM56_243 [Candidatus Peribacteria bacterium]|nr:hypothetical protein [Candidatus Peribacteria bacterium]